MLRRKEIQKLRSPKIRPGERKKAMEDLGINKLHFAFDPENMPGVDPTAIAAQDVGLAPAPSPRA